MIENPQFTPNKAETIRTMFGLISKRYDLANTVLSMGIHHLWRRRVVKWSGVRAGAKVLDCATGTGDLAFEFEKITGPAGEVVGTDFCAEMLEPARPKAQARGSLARFEVADVTRLPYETDRFDAASISFGIRNVNDPVQGLREMARVVRPGGVVMVLEFGQPSSALIRAAYGFYASQVLPRVGGWISGRRDAYEYLQDSSAKFPCGEEFLNLARSTGAFSRLEYRPVSGGIAFIYRLVKQQQQG